MLKAEEVVIELKKRYGRRERKEDPFYTLIFTILSQRTRDEQTEKAAEKLFERYSNAEELADADVKEIEELIRGVGFYREKAKRVKEVALRIKNLGGVPDTIEDLLKLPGVGRKTANCVLLYGFGVNALPVDTHVHRVSNRLGLVTTKKPEDTEVALKALLPKELWRYVNDLFISFGRDICRPIAPRCNACPFREGCRYCLYYLSA
jgi:endonuclease-3